VGFDTTQPAGWIAYRLATCVGIIVMSWTAARLIEWPMLGIRDRYFPSRSAPPMIVPAERPAPQLRAVG
jgi:hypothetical protein